MKKTYIIPTVDVCELETKHIIAESLPLNNGETLGAGESLADEWRINLDDSWWDE